MNLQKLLPLLSFSLLAACGDDDNTPAPGADTSVSDASDAGGDVSIDTTDDTSTDAGSDAAVDVSGDTAADVGVDATADVAVDVSSDAVVDAEVGADVTDAGSDTGVDVSVDVDADADDATTCSLTCEPVATGYCEGPVAIAADTPTACALVDDAEVCAPAADAGTDCSETGMRCDAGACVPLLVDIVGDMGFSTEPSAAVALADDGSWWHATMPTGQWTEMTDVPADAVWPPTLYGEEIVLFTESNALYAQGLDASIGIGDDATTGWSTLTELTFPTAVGTIRSVGMSRDALVIVNTDDELFVKGSMTGTRDWDAPLATGIATAWTGSLQFIAQKTDGSYVYLGDFGWAAAPSATVVAYPYTGAVTDFSWVWDYGCILDGVGQPYCMERNHGNFGNPDDFETHSLAPYGVPADPGFEHIGAFRGKTCVLDDANPGLLTCWGLNLGSEFTTVAPRGFVLPDGVEFSVIDSAANVGLAVDQDGAAYVFDVSPTQVILTPIRFAAE